MRTIQLALALGTVAGVALQLTYASAQQAAPKIYANDISNVPCAAFRNNGDGSWTELATPSTSNRVLFQGNIYSGALAKQLEKRCGRNRS